MKLVNPETIPKVTVEDIDTEHDVSYFIRLQDIFECPDAPDCKRCKEGVVEFGRAIMDDHRVTPSPVIYDTRIFQYVYGLINNIANKLPFKKDNMPKEIVKDD